MGGMTSLRWRGGCGDNDYFPTAKINSCLGSFRSRRTSLKLLNGVKEQNKEEEKENPRYAQIQMTVIHCRRAKGFRLALHTCHIQVCTDTSKPYLDGPTAVTKSSRVRALCTRGNKSSDRQSRPGPLSGSTEHLVHLSAPCSELGNPLIQFESCWH